MDMSLDNNNEDGCAMHFISLQNIHAGAFFAIKCSHAGDFNNTLLESRSSND